MKRFRTRGFTLMELLIVVVIIAILAALLLPILKKAQQKANARACMGKARTMGTQLRTYSSQWEGYSPPDPETFMTRDKGYKAYWENGYFDGDNAGSWYVFGSSAGANLSESQKRASKIKDFICPMDTNAAPNKHGIPNSYMIASQYCGYNLSSLSAEDSKTIAVGEKGRRHVDESGLRNESYYIFGDLHAELGSTLKTEDELSIVPGLRMRVWHTNNFSNVAVDVAESRLPVIASDATTPLRYESIWSSDLVSAGPLWLAVLDGYSYDEDWELQTRIDAGTFWGGTGNNMAKFPNTYTVRWDGLIKFPRPGNWEFYLEFAAVAQGGAAVNFAIGDEDDVLDATAMGTVHATANDPSDLYIKTGVEEGQFYPIKLLYRGDQWNGTFKITWTRKDGTRTDPDFRNEVVSTSYLFHVPQ